MRKKTITICLFFVIALITVVSATAFTKEKPHSFNEKKHTAITDVRHNTPGKKIAFNRFARNNTFMTDVSQNVTGSKSLLVSDNLRDNSPRFLDNPDVDFYGFMNYSSDGSAPALQKLNTNGGITNMWYTTAPGNHTMYYGNDGKIHAYIMNSMGGFLYGYSFCTFDFNTGNVIENIDLFNTAEEYVQLITYDAESDIIYALLMNAYGEYFLGKINPQNPGNVTMLQKYDTNDFESMPLCIAYYNDAVYYVSIAGDIMFFDIQEKKIRTLSSGKFDFPLAAYMSGMCYLPSIDAFVVNLCKESDTIETFLYKINTDGNVSRLAKYDNSESYSSLFTDKPVIRDPGTPAKPECIDNSFKSTPELSGTFTIKLPETDALGNNFANGTVLKLQAACGEIEGTTDKTSYTPGATAIVSFRNVPENRNLFTFVVSNGKLNSKLTVTQYCGYDFPSTPTNVKLTRDEISWDAVTIGANNGYVSNILYDVYIDDEKVRTDINTTSCTYNLPESEFMAHYAEVVAKSNGKNSEPGKSNKLVAGNPFELPVFFAPTKEEADLFQIVDANNDGNYWHYTEIYDGSTWFVNPCGTTPCNDWLFLPAMNLNDASSLYQFTMDAANMQPYYMERFEVYIGNAPTSAAMTTPLINETRIPYSNTPNNPLLVSAVFTIPTADTYYIGVHGVSVPYADNLLVKNLRVSKSDISPDAPNSITALKITPAEKGELSCSLDFTMPKTTMLNLDLDPNITLTATAKSEIGIKTVTGKQGQNVSIKDLVTKQGVNKIEVYVSFDGKDGLTTSGSVYTGVDIPGAPTNFKIHPNADNMSAILSWEAPAEGQTGGYVSPANNTYFLCVEENSPYGKQWIIEKELGTDIFEYTYTLPEETRQNIVRLGIVAQNIAGQGSKVAEDYSTLGLPVSIPVLENISEQKGILVEPIVYTFGEWYMGDPANLDDMFGLTSFANKYNFALMASHSGGNAEIQLPRFSTIGIDNPSFILDAYYGKLSCIYSVYASAFGMERELIGQPAKDENGYDKIKISIPEKFKNLPWVQIDLAVNFTSEGGGIIQDDVAIIQGYQIKNDIAKDLMIGNIEGNQTVEIGKEKIFKAVVRNIGNEDYPSVTVRFDLKKDDKVIATETKTSNEALASDCYTKIDFTHTFGVDELGKCMLEATITDEDSNSKNNTTSIEITVNEEQSFSCVDDLHAVRYNETTNQVILTWSKPAIKFYDGTFESADETLFSPENICGFRNFDGDNAKVYKLNGIETPNATLPGAFTVWSAEEIAGITGDPNIYPANDGDKYLVAFCPMEGPDDYSVYAANDWLISKEVKGGTDVSFHMCAIANQYGDEIVELCYSSTGDEIEDFKILETFSFHNVDWEEFTATLPNDAKYFAIHYRSHDIFGIFLDDINYTSAKENVTITGYDIYRDGVLIAKNSAPDCSYIDIVDNPTKTYNYQVVPVLSDNTHGLYSNTATINMSSSVADSMQPMRFIASGKGTITVNGYKGKEINIFSIDGKHIATCKNAEDTYILNIEPGFYIVRVSDTDTKVLVK